MSLLLRLAWLSLFSVWTSLEWSRVWGTRERRFKSCLADFIEVCREQAIRSALGAEACRFESCHLDFFSGVVQWQQRLALNQEASGSIPTPGTLHPDARTGIAASLRTMCLWVRLPLWVPCWPGSSVRFEQMPVKHPDVGSNPTLASDEGRYPNW